MAYTNNASAHREGSMSVEKPANYGGSAKLMARDADRAKQSAAEDAMGALLDSLGLPYERQFKYAEGRQLKADFAVCLVQGKPFDPLEYPSVLIEIIGGVYPFRRTRKDGSEVMLPGAHGTVGGIKADCERLNEATINGWCVLRFLPEQVKDGTARKVLERWLE